MSDVYSPIAVFIRLYRMLGDLARVSGRPTDALAHYRAAAAMNLRVNARPHLALSRLGHAQALIALGTPHDPETDASVAQLRDLAAAEFDNALTCPAPSPPHALSRRWTCPR